MKYTERIGAQTLFLSLSLVFLATERKRKRDARRIPLRNTQNESQCLNGCLKCGGDRLSAKEGGDSARVTGSPQTWGWYFPIFIFITSSHRCLPLVVTAPSHWNTDSDEKKKTTTEPASLAACLPAPWLASVFFGCIVTAGRTRHLIDRHPSVTNECYNRLASYVSYQWRHAVRFIHTNSRRSRMTDPEDASNLGCAYEESIRTSSRLEDSFSPRMKFLDGRKIGQTIRGRKQN